MQSLHALDWLFIALYFAGMGYLGFHFSRKNRDTEEYFLGGRGFKGWVIGLSMVGTSISSNSFLAYPADAYATAWMRMLPNFLMPLAGLFAIYVIVPFYRSGHKTTAYQYLGLRFGRGIRQYGSVAFILTQFIRLGIVLYLVSKMLSAMLGWPIWLCIIAAGLVVATYTIVGGIDAVIWTDVVQTIILVGGGILVFCVMLPQIPGGLAAIVDIAGADSKLSFSEMRDGRLVPVSWGWALSEKTGLMLLVLGLTQWLQEFSADQNVVQRYCAAASDKEARKAVWWSVLSRLPIWAFFMFLGTTMYVFFKFHPSDAAAAMLDGREKPEGILPYFVMNYLPPGMAGLIISAAVAAAMSSLDSSMNAISAVFVTDLYRGGRWRKRDEAHYLRVAKCAAGAAAVVMVGLAILFAYADTKTIQDLSTILTSVFGGGLLGLFFFGFFTTWGDGRAAGAGIIATVAYTVAVLLGEAGKIPMPSFDLYYTAIIGNLVMFFTCLLVAYFLPRRGGDSILEDLTVWTRRRR